MDLNYDIEKECSLRTVTMVDVVRCVLESSGLVPNFQRRLEDIASDAFKKLDGLHIPSVLKEDMKGLVRPMLLEICSWYVKYTLDVRPVLTRCGTLDLTKSILALLGISDVENALNEQGIFISKIYWEIYSDQFQPPVWCKIPTASDFSFCFMNGLSKNDQRLIKWSVDSVPKDHIHKFAVNFVFREALLTLFSHTTELPAIIYYLVFSRMDENDQKALQVPFSDKMLTALLKWPYQHLFMKAARTLAQNLNDDMCCAIAMKILTKKLSGYKDHDYRRLFVEFWALSVAQRHRFCLSDTNVYRLANLVRVMKDEKITTFVLRSTSDKFKLQLMKRGANVMSHVCKEFNNACRFQELEAEIAWQRSERRRLWAARLYNSIYNP